MRSLASVVRTSTAVLCLAFLASPAVVRAGEGRPGPATANISSIRIDNFGQVDNALYRGGQPEARDFPALAALGIKTVINLTSDDAMPEEQAMTERAAMRYVQIPMTTHQPPTAEQLTQFLSIINDPANQPVYVHCVGGRHRTGVMTAVYRMTHGGWTPERAFNEMKHYKFGADFLHPEFKEFVYSYHPAPGIPQATPLSPVPLQVAAEASADR